MIRVGHTADIHLSSGPRFDDTMRVLEWIAQDGAERGVQLWLVAGDATGVVVPHVASIEERNGFAAWLRQLAETAPTILLAGNHDRIGNAESESDLAIYGQLRAKHPIRVVTRPEMIDVAGARVYCLPFPSKKYAMASGAIGGALTEQKVGMEGGLRAILDAWRLDAAEQRTRGIPTIGCAHVNIAGSKMGGGEILNVGAEIELAPHDLAELDLDAGCLGHLHLCQEMSPGWWYSGTPARQSFGEESYACSYNLLEVESGHAPEVVQRPTPARRLVTVRMEWGQDPEINEGRWALVADDVPRAIELADADVRLIVQVPEDGVDSCPFEKFEADILGDGANSVKLERRILPKTRVRSEAITRAITIQDQIAAYFDSLETPPDKDQRARVLEKLAELHVEDRGEEIAA